jgi:NAD(P)H-hydrate epimerase
MISTDEMAVVDANAAALGVPRKQLMESSGNAVARAVREHADPGASVAVVCGRGNNGGDAMVTARFLDEYDVTVHLLGRAETITTGIARESWDALLAAEYEATEVRDSAALDLGDPDLVVDAMLGTGVKGALREPERSSAEAINATGATVISVDVPSGVDADTGTVQRPAVAADHVVTFHDEKAGLAELDCGVTVADIGIPKAAERFVGNGDLLRIERDQASHKGVNGEVLVVGGGPYTGAPALCAQAALRAGADLVRVACPEAVAREVQGYSEDLILTPFAGERLVPVGVHRLLAAAEGHDTVVFGPGLGDDEETLEAVRTFLEQYDGTAVVDADALQVVPELETDATLVCTPHQGELQKMGGKSDEDWAERATKVESFAADLNQTLLVKGVYDVVSDGERTRVSRTGNAAMTVGGTGDVLAGVTAALASVLDTHDAACVAAYANGRAGDLVVAGEAGHPPHGNGLLATDLVDAMPAALEPEGFE